MEISRTRYRLLHMVRTGLCILLFFAATGFTSWSQEVRGKYSIKEGKMYIMISKAITDASLDSFIAQYGLYDLPLKQFLKTNIQDSLQKLGWEIEKNNNSETILSKSLMAFEEFDSPADRIMFTEKHLPGDDLYPEGYKEVTYGFNRFKNSAAFTTTDSTAIFHLRGNRNAKQVLLAGSFNNWQHGAWPMTLTDSGWAIKTNLPAGKHFYKFIVDGNWITDPDNQLRENDGRGNTNSIFYKTNTVFRLPGFTTAKKVYLAGSFNEWRLRELQLEKTASGWQLPLYLAEGTHTYKFVVDGDWYTDKGNPEQQSDGHKGFNSVLRIGNPYIFRLDGHPTAKQVVLAGSFNGWRDNELLMTKTEGGWELPYVLGPGNYAYRFKVDGNWQVNPSNPSNGKNAQNDFALIIEPNYTFRLKGFGHAQTVYLAGTFNDWNPSNFPMQREGEDWVFPVHLSTGKHLYKFIVDGKWILDPTNKLWEQNEHQTGNSVLWVEK